MTENGVGGVTGREPPKFVGSKDRHFQAMGLEHSLVLPSGNMGSVNNGGTSLEPFKLLRLEQESKMSLLFEECFSGLARARWRTNPEDGVSGNYATGGRVQI